VEPTETIGIKEGSQKKKRQDSRKRKIAEKMQKTYQPQCAQATQGSRVFCGKEWSGSLFEDYGAAVVGF